MSSTYALQISALLQISPDLISSDPQTAPTHPTLTISTRPSNSHDSSFDLFLYFFHLLMSSTHELQISPDLFWPSPPPSPWPHPHTTTPDSWLTWFQFRSVPFGNFFHLLMSSTHALQISPDLFWPSLKLKHCLNSFSYFLLSVDYKGAKKKPVTALWSKNIVSQHKQLTFM